MKKQYVKPEIEVYDLEDVPMVLCSSPGVNYDGNINKPKPPICASETPCARKITGKAWVIKPTGKPCAQYNENNTR